MPPLPRWYADLPRIRRELEAIPESHTTIDRATFQVLFGVKARRANTLMGTVKGRRVGSGIEVFRSDLIAWIDTMTGPRGVATAEIQQKLRSDAFINTLQRKARPKRIPSPPPKPVGATLPAGVRMIAPGELLITFSTPEELCSRNLALAHAAVEDFASFAAALEFLPPRNCDCTAGESSPSTSFAPVMAPSGDEPPA